MLKHLVAAGLAALTLGLSAAMAQDARSIAWSDLIPPGSDQPVSSPAVDHESGPAQQTSPLAAPPVIDLDGERITMPGFMLPLEYTDDGAVTGFLLVPYVGACIHVPPPPANQIVFVEIPGEPVRPKGMWDPVQVTGTMAVRMKVNDLGDAAYTLTLEKMEPYRR